MSEVHITDGEIRGILRQHAVSAAVRDRVDPFERRVDRLVTVCLEADELEVGLVLLIAFKLRLHGHQGVAMHVLLEDPRIGKTLLDDAAYELAKLRHEAGQGGAN